MDNFVNRLEYILEYYELTASAFADKVGVQRSSLSHLLSGRNKPSLDFILKVKDTYPTLSFDWLIKGEGHFSSDHAADFSKDSSFGSSQKSTVDHALSSQKTLSGETQNNLTSTVNDNTFMHAIANNDIAQIIVFYNDGTFNNFKPRK